jgi:type I restriction enzyme S subunit
VLPPRRMQAAFDERFGGALRQAVVLESATRTLRKARDLLLPRLISGEIDVTDLDIDVTDLAA